MDNECEAAIREDMPVLLVAGPVVGSSNKNYRKCTRTIREVHVGREMYAVVGWNLPE